MNNQDLKQQIDTVVKGCSGVDELQVQTKDTSEPGPCNFLMLPEELQSRIFIEFMLAVNSSEKKLVALTSISRLWRTVVLNTQLLWRRLVISGKTTREKVDTWLQRAGGTFSRLLFLEGFDFDTLSELFGGTPANIWSSLKHLEVRSKVLNANLLPPTIYKELRLKSLMLSIVLNDFDSPSATFWKLLWTIDGSRMRDLQIRANWNLVRMAGFRFTDLVTLRLHCKIKESDLLDVLERNPMLERLTLSHVARSLGRPGSSRRVELVNLTKLELSGSGRGKGCVQMILQCLILPKLEVLHIFRCTIRSPVANLGNAYSTLREIVPTHLVITSSGLITLLRKACALRELAFVDPETRDVDTMEFVLEALASPIPGESEGIPPTFCCPRLQHVDLVGVTEITTESVMRVVKSRLPSIGSATTLEKSAVRPLPIVHLMLDNCQSVGRESVPWFEANVPEFICR